MNRSTIPMLAALGATLLAWGCGTNPPTSPITLLPNADSLAMTPDTATVSIGSAFRFSVTAFDSGGNVISANLHFSSSNAQVFTVDPSGRVVGMAEGSGVVRVTSGAASDSATVIVIAARRGWFTQTSDVATTLSGVFFLANGADGWAVGDGGRILHTTDGGSTWSQETSGSASTLASVWFTGTTEGWVAGGSGTVLHTTDGGASWSRLLNLGTTENLTDVWFATRDTGWVVGGHGVILRTFDRGTSWQQLTPTGFDLNSVSFAGTRDGWAVGDNGVILGTHDRGLTWYTVQPSLTSQPLRGVWRLSAALANAAGAAGVTLRTAAAADSAMWQLGNAGSLYDLRAVCFPTAGVGYVVGYNLAGAVLRSDDGGASWQPQVANTGSRLKDVFFVDSARGWAVGENGVIVHTVTGGAP